MSFRALVHAALDAGGFDRRSTVAQWALDKAADVEAIVCNHWNYRYVYHFRFAPDDIDAQSAALNLVILAEREAARGVRAIGRTAAHPSK